MKQKVLKTIYKAGGFSLFHKLFPQKTMILTYHRFSKSDDPYKISAAKFEKHLAYLKKHVTVMSLDSVVKARMDGSELPKNPTVITIDDGYDDAYKIAYPLLKKYEMPATLYAITDFIDGKVWLWTDLMRYILLTTKRRQVNLEFDDGNRLNVKLSDKFQRMEIADRINTILKSYQNDEKDLRIDEIAKTMSVAIPAKPADGFSPVSWKQVLEMDKSVLKIGSHTVTHPILPNVDHTQLDQELINAKRRLEQKLKRSVEHFCYPNGSFNNRVKKAVKKAGYKSAVTTQYGLSDKQNNLYSLNRIDASANIENFAQSASGFEFLRQKIKL